MFYNHVQLVREICEDIFYFMEKNNLLFFSVKLKKNSSIIIKLSSKKVVFILLQNVICIPLILPSCCLPSRTSQKVPTNKSKNQSAVCLQKKRINSSSHTQWARKFKKVQTKKTCESK